MKFSHLNNDDILVIDYSGTITLDKGLSNMKIIEDEIQTLSSNVDCLKIIFDVRNTIWENMETHNTLSKIAREIFNPHNLNLMVYTAILNNEISGPTFENEHWFVEKEEAIKWLIERNKFDLKIFME